MDVVDSAFFYQQYRDWYYRLNGGRRSRHHLIPRCRWSDMHEFFKKYNIRGIKRSECRTVDNEHHAHWHHVFGILTPLEIIHVIHQKKFDLRRFNIWQTIGWLMIFFRFEAEEACYQAQLFEPKILKEPGTIDDIIENIICCWSPKVYNEMDFEELLILAALLLFLLDLYRLQGKIK